MVLAQWLEPVDESPSQGASISYQYHTYLFLLIDGQVYE